MAFALFVSVCAYNLVEYVICIFYVMTLLRGAFYSYSVH